MSSDRKLGLYTEVTLKKGDEYVGENQRLLLQELRFHRAVQRKEGLAWF
ncbi:hypothetical protein MUO83_03835 [Candidatus Bathyarchaeota archaeon]|nr:hypothetical protein [Candidatus Bathyarchaeota archaeon]